MAAIEATGYAISLPAEWYQLPGSRNTGDALAAIVSGFDLPDETAERVKFALQNVNGVSFEAPGRSNFALIRNPASGRVDAIMSISFPRQSAQSLADYREAARSVIPIAGLEQVERTVSEYPLPAGPAIVVHEFVLPRTDGGVSDPAVERAIVALFPDGFDSFFEFSIKTQDLTVFEDAAEYLLDIVAQVHLSAEAPAA
ncbi:MAG: hypothetical protein JWO10_2142 [Microbacteriaceae bacterium]|nr:hypothetical protein [Microbacteriaceae bacterium]